MSLDPLLIFLIVLLIGIGAGFLAQRYVNSWLRKQIGGRRSLITHMLVGIAGSFIGYHIALLLGALNTLVLFVAAAIGAALILWLWRELRV